MIWFYSSKFILNVDHTRKNIRKGRNSNTPIKEKFPISPSGMRKYPVIPRLLKIIPLRLSVKKDNGNFFMEGKIIF